MSKRAELEAKIEKTRANKSIPENLKAGMIISFEKQIAKLPAEEKPADPAPGKKPRKARAKKAGEPKPKTKSSYKFKGKPVDELNDEECEEAIKESRERREKAAKSEKKSKSRPVMEKVTSNVVKAVKQAIENIPAEDLKDHPKAELNKIKRITTAAKNFVRELKSILGEDFDKDTIEGEFKEIHALTKELSKKYGD